MYDDHMNCSHENCSHTINRRNFLYTAAAAGAGALVGMAGTGSAQASPSAKTTKPHRIDVHHHIFTPRYIAEARPQILSGLSPNMAHYLDDWSPSSDIEQMDRGGIATAIMSLCVPGVWLGSVPAARALARDVNEYGARMMADYPGRYGLFASLPLPDVEGSLKEVEYAMDTLKADGILLYSNFQDKYLGDPAFEPLFAELNRRNAVVHVHPANASCCININAGGVGPAALEYPVDTARTMLSLLFGGTFSRYPNVRFVMSHCGGVFPLAIERFKNGNMEKYWPHLIKNVPKGIDYEIQKLFYDTAVSYSKVTISTLLSTVPESQVLYGTDAPFFDIVKLNERFHSLGFDPKLVRSIERENALPLFPRLRA